MLSAVPPQIKDVNLVLPIKWRAIVQGSRADSLGPCPTHLIADQVATEDAFRHAAIANAIAEMILTEDRSCAIALTGTWGSGKSTVVSLLRERLAAASASPDVGTFVFDAWAHQGDPLRRTFLEKLIEWCNDRPGGWTRDKRHWSDTIDQLAKRKERIESKSTPHLTPLGAAGALSLLLVPLALQIYQKFNYRNHPAWEALAFVAGMLPLLIGLALLAWWFLTEWKKPEHRRRPIPSFISTTVENDVKTFTSKTPDPTSVEFEKFYSELMAEVLDGNQRRIVLVMDNLDRVNRDYAKAVWATLRVFFDSTAGKLNGWHHRVWVLVPFDPEAIDDLWEVSQVAAGDGGRASLSRHFLEKTFETTFQVPAPILSSWERYLRDRLGEAFPRHSAAEFHTIFRLYDLLGNHDSDSVTPRNLKIFVNRVAAVHRQWQDVIPLEHQAAFVLVSDSPGSIPAVLNGATLLQRPSTPLTLRELLHGDWQRNLAAIHFNVEPDKAFEAMLHEPISKALRNGDGKALAELEMKAGFPAEFERAIEQIALSSSLELRPLSRAATAFSFLRGDWHGHSDCQSLLFGAAVTLTSWEPLNLETAKGLGFLVKLAPQNADLAPVVQGVRDSLAATAGGRSDPELRNWCAGLFILLPSLIARDKTAVSKHFSIQGTAAQYLAVIQQAQGSEGFEELSEFLVPAAPRNEILKALAQKITEGRWDESGTNAVWAISHVAGKWDWKDLVSSFRPRIENVQQQLPADLPYVLETLYLLPWDSEVKVLLSEPGRGEVLLQWLHLLIPNQHYRAAAICILPLLEGNLQIQPQPGGYQPNTQVWRIQQGRQVLWPLIQNPKSNPALMSELASHFDSWLRFEEWRKVAEAKPERRPIISEALKHCLEERGHAGIGVDELMDHLDFWREVAGESVLHRLLTLKAKSGVLSHALMKRPFSTSERHLHLLSLIEDPNDAYVGFLIEKLHKRTEQEWIEALTTGSEMLEIAFRLKGLGLRLGREFQDALYAYAKQKLSSSVRNAWTDRWPEVTGLLSAEDYSVLQHRITTLFRDQSGPTSGLLLFYGSELSRTVLQDGPENYFQPIKPMIERHDPTELDWLSGVVDHWQAGGKKLDAIRKDWADRAEECMQKKIPDADRTALQRLLQILRKPVNP